jgi:hypothetical protein
MILVRSGGAIGLVVAAFMLFVVRPGIDFDYTADRATPQPQPAIAPGDAYAQIKRTLGPDAELLSVTVTEQGGGSVTYRDGSHAEGFRWGPGHDGLEPVQVTLVGPGRLADNVFPIARFEPAATRKLTAAVRSRAGAGYDVEAMTLAVDPATGAVRWTVTGEDGRSFTARSDASRLRRVE